VAHSAWAARSNGELLGLKPALSLSPAEKVYVQKLAMDARDGNSASQKRFHLFWRLLPYFRGKHYVEEIMWLENIDRQQIFQVRKAYHACLTTVQHE
jgi:hypothetical protein